jgi:hypothetical protein
MTISRFDRTVPGLVQKALSGRPHTTAGDKRSSPSLSDQVLALASGKTKQEIARPNHVGAAISRHKRAGRIEERDGKLYATQSTGTEQRPRSDTGMN